MASSNSVTKGNGKSARGFASMDKERQRAIASEGGRAAHQSGNAHQFTSEEARRAGRQSRSGAAARRSAAAGAVDPQGGGETSSVDAADARIDGERQTHHNK